jgi:two-component system, chemotaxis family, chemotaxis protein CheY
MRRFKLGNTVLIVDDAEFMRVMLREILEDMDWTVTGEAADGAEAIDKFQRSQPDLVLMDITMPHMDGIEALRAILQQNPQALVVMITALGQKDQVLSAIKAGARDFIIKPFDQERVQDTLSRLLPACPVG